jgi:signal transduction histidine kinase
MVAKVYFNYAKKLFLLEPLFFLLSIMTSDAQQKATDSLEKIIMVLHDDTVKVNRLNDLASKLQFVNPQKAAAKVLLSAQLSKKINYPIGLATAYRVYGVLYVDRMVLDSGKMFYDSAYAIVKNNKEQSYQRLAGLITHNYGAIYHRKQQYDSATMKYTEAIKIFADCGEEGLCFFPYTNLATIFSYLKDNDKALYYAKGAYAAADKLKDQGKIVSAVNSEMSIRLELHQYDSVLIPLKQNLLAASALQNFYQQGISNNLLGNYYGYGRGKYDSSVFFVKNALLCMQKVNNEYEMTNMMHNLGYYYERSDNADSALHYLNMAIVKARSLGMDQVVQYSLKSMVDVEEKRGNITAAYKYLRELLAVNDSVQAENNREQVNELEARYQAEKKEAQINQLKAKEEIQRIKIRQKNLLNYFFAAVALLLILLTAALYRSYQQKQVMQQKRITELEKEKQLAATEAVLKGEEQERTRLAKDLHDGLGGMLSGIKYSLNTMKGNLIMTPDNVQAFERSMDMLDSSIKEMRRVAHNMMPEALVKFGLDTALKDFCNDINQSGALKVNYQSIGLNKAVIDQTTAITIYRVIQELLNNTMKHAGAANAIVQVSKTADVLSVTVEDDGKGFDTAILHRAKGIGWSNIQNRVEFLKGKLDVNSEKGKGTSVLIELTA